MHPSPPSLNVADARVMDAESSGQFAQACLPPCGSDGPDIGLSEFCPALPFTLRRHDEACRISVANVGGWRHPFQVRGPVVDLDAVLVIGLATRRARSQERLGYQSVNVSYLHPASDGNADVQVATLLPTGLQEPPATGAAAGADSPHPAQAGNVVPALIPDDRAPFFQRQGDFVTLGLHREVLLSGAVREAAPCSAPASLYQGKD